MSSDEPPYQPDKEEIEGAKALELPGDDNHANGMLEIARRAFGKKEYDNAIKILQGLVIARPDDARIYESFGIIHQAKGELSSAIACFEVAIGKDAKAPIANVNLGEIAWRKHKDRERAAHHLEIVVADDPNGPVGQRARATLVQLQKTK